MVKTIYTYGFHELFLKLMKNLSSLVFHFVHIAEILQEHFKKFVDEIYIKLGEKNVIIK
jgi:hypothetical protein